MDSSDDEAEQLSAERVHYDRVYEKFTTDKTQPAKSVKWSIVAPEDLPRTCIRTKEGTLGTEYPAQMLNVTGPVLKGTYSYFKHLLPPMWLERFARTANRSLTEDPIDKNYRKTTPAEIEAIFGECLAAALMGVDEFATCFAVSPDPNSVFPPAAFGQYGISKNRALIIMRAAHLSDGPMQPPGESEHWFIDNPLEEFNTHMHNNFRPGWLGCMDESGPMWHGGEGIGDFRLNPHNSFVPRKPEPLCAEVNDSGCALSRVMTFLEFEKAKAFHGDEKFTDVTGSYNAAMAMRLAQPWANKNGAIYGDSRFGSVKSAVFTWKHLKVHTAYDVKTATALYPRNEIIRLCPKENHATIVMTATVDGVKLYAVGQRRGPAVHTFLTTFGTFNQEIPTRFKKCNSLSEAPWTTPSILNKVTQSQPMVDTFNRQLFDILGMQYCFRTACFETRWAQHFLMPVTYINAINAAKYFEPAAYRESGTKSMLIVLASSMVHNPEWMEILNTPRAGPGGGGQCRSGRSFNARESTWSQVRIDGGPPSRESPAKHVLILLHQLEGYKGAKQQRCWECNELVSWCCVRCSNANSWVPLHPPVAQGSNRRFSCLAAHRNNPAGGYKVSHQVLTGVSSTAKRRRRIPMEVL